MFTGADAALPGGLGRQHHGDRHVRPHGSHQALELRRPGKNKKLPKTTTVTCPLENAPSSNACDPHDDHQQDLGWRSSCQRYIGQFLVALLSLLAFLSPIVMVLLPRLVIEDFLTWNSPDC